MPGPKTREREYRLWFRHTGEEEPGNDWADSRIEQLSLRDEVEYFTSRERYERIPLRHTGVKKAGDSSDSSDSSDNWTALRTRRPITRKKVGTQHADMKEPGDDWAESRIVPHTFRQLDRRLQGQHKITHMVIDDNDAPEAVLERATELTHLCIVVRSSVIFSHQLITWMKQLTNLQSLSLHSKGWVLNRVLLDPLNWDALRPCLTKLELVGFNFSKGLPDELLLSISQLHTLKVTNCQLKELPTSIQNLTSLTVLDLTGNKLETLPSSVYHLPCIDSINLRSNPKLKFLGSSILEMSKLKRLPKLHLDGCYKLCQPPLDICLQGMDAVKHYYMALLKEESCLLTLLTVGVLGESFSGKTSLVKSLKSGRRYLTDRSSKYPKGEATVVFNYETVDTHNGKTDIRFIDLGGNSIYHPTYRLTFKSNFLPIVVIDIRRFMDLSIKRGYVEATRRLCFDWMAQFYLTQPDLSRPLLVLTHKDMLSQEMLNHYKSVLLKTIAQMQRAANMKAFSDETRPIFEKIFVVGKDDSFDELQSLLTCIEDSCKIHMFNFPASWWSMMRSIELMEEPYLNIESLKGMFTDISSLFVILRFMHRSGRIIWYEDLTKDIASKIFHDVKQITRTVGILFNHLATWQWNERKNDYEDEKVTVMINEYQRTGMMNERLLIQVLQDESEIPVDDVLTLMKSFYLIYGRIHRSEDEYYYAVPYLVQSYRNNQWMNDGEIRLRLRLYLDSPYALPQHAYQQLSLLLADLDCHQNSSLVIKRNGATIYHKGWKLHFIHDHNNSQVTLQASTIVEKLVQSWTSLRASVREILDFLSREWEAVRPQCIFYCGSCLLTDQLRPDTDVSPSWCIRPGSEVSGTEMVYCEEECCEVPACLVKPCSTLSADDMDCVKKYIREHHYDSTADCNPVTTNEDSVAPCTPSQPPQQEDMWETPRKLDNLMKRSADPNITLTPQQTPESRQELYFNTDQVYPMSGGVRGRALIISNEYRSWIRRGAEQDFINLKRMFESFHFDVVGEHKDYTAQEIHDTIVRETEEPCHHRYGMFALVITSHGDDGLVYGNDDHSIKLSDIYGLLSATKFPAMKGKPKLVIIEAGSGGVMDAPAVLGGPKKKVARMINKTPITVNTTHDTNRLSQDHGASSSDTGEVHLAGSNTSSQAEPNLSMDHLMIIKASMAGFGSVHHPRNGSWLVRALVIAFYKYGHWMDLEALCVTAKEQVRLMSIARSKERRDTLGQIPDLTCTFTNGRSLYLFPGYHGNCEKEQCLEKPDELRHIKLSQNADGMVNAEQMADSATLHATASTLESIDNSTNAQKVRFNKDKEDTIGGSSAVYIGGFHDAEFDLYDLDEPEDEHVVTAVVMTTCDGGLVNTLFKLIAGKIVDKPERKEEDMRVVTVCINNDLLHDEIKKQCLRTFIAKLEEPKRQIWKQNSPYFIVTPLVPHYDNTGTIILIEQIIESEIPLGNGGGIYDFRHPENNTVGFRIHEPASPASVYTMTQRSSGEPESSHNMEEEKREMPQDVKRKLKQEQAKLIGVLRKHHSIGGRIEDAVTAVVWSLTKENDIQQQQTGVILVNGVLTGPTNKLNGDHLGGVAVNLTWIYSEDFEKKTRESGFVSIDPRELSRDGLSCLTKSRGLASQSDSVQFDKVGSWTYGVKSRYGHWDFQAVHRERLHSWVTNKLFVSSDNRRMMLADILPKTSTHSSLPLPSLGDQKSEKVTVCVHEIVTPTTCNPRHFDFRRELFILLAKGNGHNINLPRLFTYHDPLHLWTCQTWQERLDHHYLSLIQEHRMGQSQSSSVAEHILLHKNENSSGRATLYNKKKKTIPLDVWTHEPDDGGLLHELRQNPKLLEWKKFEVDSDALEQQIIADWDSIPISFKHPTIQFKLKRLPEPNQMGMNSQTNENPSAGFARGEPTTPQKKISCAQIFSSKGKEVASKEVRTIPEIQDPNCHHQTRISPAVKTSGTLTNVGTALSCPPNDICSSDRDNQVRRSGVDAQPDRDVLQNPNESSWQKEHSKHRKGSSRQSTVKPADSHNNYDSTPNRINSTNRGNNTRHSRSPKKRKYDSDSREHSTASECHDDQSYHSTSTHRREKYNTQYKQVRRERSDQTNPTSQTTLRSGEGSSRSEEKRKDDSSAKGHGGHKERYGASQHNHSRRRDRDSNESSWQKEHSKHRKDSSRQSTVKPADSHNNYDSTPNRINSTNRGNNTRHSRSPKKRKYDSDSREHSTASECHDDQSYHSTSTHRREKYNTQYKQVRRERSDQTNPTSQTTLRSGEGSSRSEEKRKDGSSAKGHGGHKERYGASQHHHSRRRDRDSNESSWQKEHSKHRKDSSRQSTVKPADSHNNYDSTPNRINSTNRGNDTRHSRSPKKRKYDSDSREHSTASECHDDQSYHSTSTHHREKYNTQYKQVRRERSDQTNPTSQTTLRSGEGSSRSEEKRKDDSSAKGHGGHKERYGASHHHHSGRRDSDAGRYDRSSVYHYDYHSGSPISTHGGSRTRQDERNHQQNSHDRCKVSQAKSTSGESRCDQAHHRASMKTNHSDQRDDPILYAKTPGPPRERVESCHDLFVNHDNEAHFKCANNAVHIDPDTHDGVNPLIERIVQLLKKLAVQSV